MEGLQTTSEGATRRSSRWHSTADFFEGWRIIFPSGAVVRRRFSGGMCRSLCVDACQAGKPYLAEVGGPDFFSGLDSEAAFASPFSTGDGNRCLRRMMIFCELSGDWRTAPDQPLVVSSTTIYHGSFEIDRYAGRGCRQTICIAMLRPGVDCSAPRASMASSRSCDSSFASWFCENWGLRTLAVPPAKASSGRQLPLPAHVANALRDYLRHRPRTDAPQLFVGQNLLRGRPLSSWAIAAAMDRAYRRGGFAGWFGTHWLRHSFATRLYTRGATTKEIADLLGHRLVATTDHYTQTQDLPPLAQPWPFDLPHPN